MDSVISRAAVAAAERSVRSGPHDAYDTDYMSRSQAATAKTSIRGVKPSRDFRETGALENRLMSQCIARRPDAASSSTAGHVTWSRASHYEYKRWS